MRRKLLKAAGFFSTTFAVASMLTTMVSAQMYYGYSYSSVNPADVAAATSFLAGASLLYVCCVLLCVLVPLVLIAYFVYRDAKQNGVENPLLWGLFSITLIGLLFYLLAARPDAMHKKGMGGTHMPPQQPTA